VLAALRERFEQRLGTARRQRHIAELVDDEQLGRLQVVLQLEQAPLIASFQQLIDQGQQRW
jgi:hypothetical protein